MLNRIKKILIIAITGTLMSLPVFAFDSTISYISINDKVYEDVEIVVLGSEVLVPFKQLANLFEIQYSGNRIDKLITFTTYDGKSGVIAEQNVTIDGVVVQRQRPVFIRQGIMENLMNEAYIKASTAEQIMGIKLTADYSSLTLNSQVSRDVAILRNSKNLLAEDDNSPKAHPDVIIPKKNGKISLNTIGLHNNMINDNMSTRGQNYHYINDTVSGNTTLTLGGKVLGGQYRAEANMYHYRQDAFMFGGVSATYINNFVNKKSGNKYWYELGKVTGRRDVDSDLGTNIMGAQIWNYEYNKKNPRDLDGYVKPTSLVRVTVNNGEPVILNTYAGYYKLSDMPFTESISNIKIEEINEDGTIDVISDERYQLYGDRPFAKEDRYSAYAGVWGYQNRFFREGQNIYRGNNKKVTAGLDYQHGLKDNVTFESKLTADKIYERTEAKSIYRIPTNDTLLVTGTQKNVNYLEGATSLNHIEYVHPKDKNLKLRATGGVSIARDIRDEDTHFGIMGKGTAEYSKDLTKFGKSIFKPKTASAKVEAYHTSPDFYIASTDSTSKNDRTGGRANGSFSFNSTNINGGYNKYYSNMNNRYEGGTIAFDEYNINAVSNIPKVATLKYNTFHKRGANDLGRNKNYTWDAGLRRTFGKWADFQAGKRVSMYDTRYEEETSMNRSYYSQFSDIYMDLNVPIPNNKGRFTLGHDFIKYKTTQYKNDYNMFRFGYVFPTWKRLTLGLGWGFRYHGQGGNDINVTLGYRAKSGQMMTVGYQYSKNGGYFIDNMFTPTTNRHSVNFVFNDAFQLFHGGLKSIGDEYSDKGIFEAIAFIDINKNGKYDKKIDIPYKDIPLKTSWSSDISYTNKSGKVISTALSSGVYDISLDMNSLPITVAPLTNDVITKTVKIENGLTTKLELPLVSTVGSVSGILTITDDYDRKLKITDFIVVMLDENGEEVNYSTVNDAGEFYISGLAPGKYTVRLDEKFVSAYSLEELQNSVIDVFIPFDYNNPTDITGQNLEYKTLSL
ncbi:MAG: hypothetical protein MJ237_07325 [bacterium]|nr:hypothetical protein [bacterium]